MPLEIVEACEWKARKELGEEASKLEIATHVKRMSKRMARTARTEHAHAAVTPRP